MIVFYDKLSIAVHPRNVKLGNPDAHSIESDHA